MTDFLVAEQTVCVIPGFDPLEDVLVIALPEDRDGGLDHALSFRRIAARPGAQPALEVGLTHKASGARFRVRLPGVTRLPADAIAVLTLSDAGQLVRPRLGQDGAMLTGERLHPATRSMAAGKPGAARKLAFVHRHSWHLDGPPSERFFDLSNPASELTITLKDDTGGAIYAIRLTETGSAEPGSADRHCSIVLAQTAPGTPQLTPSLLGQWVENRLGSVRFRAIAWIWLGNKGHYTDPDSGTPRTFGQINDSPQLTIHGKIAGSIAIDR